MGSCWVGRLADMVMSWGVEMTSSVRSRRSSQSYCLPFPQLWRPQPIVQPFLKELPFPQLWRPKSPVQPILKQRGFPFWSELPWLLLFWPQSDWCYSKLNWFNQSWAHLLPAIIVNPFNRVERRVWISGIFYRVVVGFDWGFDYREGRVPCILYCERLSARDVLHGPRIRKNIWILSLTLDLTIKISSSTSFTWLILYCPHLLLGLGGILHHPNWFILFLFLFISFAILIVWVSCDYPYGICTKFFWVPFLIAWRIIDNPTVNSVINPLFLILSKFTIATLQIFIPHQLWSRWSDKVQDLPSFFDQILAHILGGITLGFREVIRNSMEICCEKIVAFRSFPHILYFISFSLMAMVTFRGVWQPPEKLNIMVCH